jgi:two-component system KDP operon response regulator KdpE
MTDPCPRVLIIEDEIPMRRFLRASLGSQGFRLIETGSARDALTIAASDAPQLVLLDLGLPDGDGLEVTRRLREWSRVPIIVLSARGQETDKVEALDAGADDYLTKPFGVNELLARMRVALRHAAPSDRSPEPIVEVGPLRIDLSDRVVTRDGRPVRLTPIEFRLLSLLVRNAGRLLTHRQILSEVWGPGRAHQNHYVRVHMASLRRKIEDEPARPRLLVTELGVGYRFRAGGLEP